MVTEDYVSVETAKLLKEKGFRAKTNRYYNAQYGQIRTVSDTFMTDWNDDDYMRCLHMAGAVAIPTLQMAMKWLREKHKLFIQICIIPHTTITIEQKYYLFTIHKDRRTLAFRKDFPSEYYFTYEEACEAAIKYCLENLI